MDIETISIPEPPSQLVEEVEVNNEWKIKDRVYFLRGNKKPLSYLIKASGIYWFDEEKGYERELKYCENQQTCFVDEMKGDQRLSHIIFRDGMLVVPKNKTVLQKLLSLYHPFRNKLFYEYNPVQIAEDENVTLRNFGIKATEMGILKLSSDQRTFMWGSNDRKLMNVPFDEHPYSALAAWFKTDEGMEIFSNIEKRLNS